MLSEEIAKKWDIILDKDKWEIYKHYTEPSLSFDPNKVIEIDLDYPDTDKNFNKLFEEGKSFKEINQILKGKH